MYDIVMTVNSHSVTSVICCSDALQPNHKKCPVFHDGYYLQCAFTSGT